MRNLIILIVVLFAAACSKSGFEGRLLFFDGEPASNIRIAFSTETDLKKEQSKAEIVTTTNSNGRYKALGLLPDKYYTLSIVDGFFPLMNVDTDIISKITVTSPSDDIKMIDDIYLYPTPSNYGIYYYRDSKNNGRNLNREFFSYSNSIKLSEVEYKRSRLPNFYYFSPELMPSDKSIPVIKMGSLMVFHGPTDYFRYERPREICYTFKPIHLLESRSIVYYDTVSKIPRGYYLDISGFYRQTSWDTPINSKISLERIEEHSFYTYYKVPSIPGYYCFHQFTPYGASFNYSNQAFIVKVE